MKKKKDIVKVYNHGSWTFDVICRNGVTILIGDNYDRRSTCVNTARKFAKRNGMELRIEENNVK